jgi:hypothetical protein
MLQRVMAEETSKPRIESGSRVPNHPR